MSGPATRSLLTIVRTSRYRVSLAQKHSFRSVSMSSVSYDGRIFRSKANTPNGEVSAATTFTYHQADKIVWAEYSGGSIVRGHFIASLQPDDSLDARYHHINTSGELMTGKCKTMPEILEDGRLRLHETWEWTSGDCSRGESIVEEVKD